ncbi:MAG: peptidoglycan bridge formation glycyltransferase FemA/FemB family protein [Anaerolineales bacterium]|nr:peptidoglycan bridge formation glycyltransferase FemA/FemB family protein [Anaerolineales bacterium]
MPLVPVTEWKNFLSNYPDVHLLQTSSWGEFKTAFGWRVYHIIVGQVGAQILVRPLGFGFSWAYLPKGPVGPSSLIGDAIIRDEVWDTLIPELDTLCKRTRAVFLKVEPDLFELSDGEKSPSPTGLIPSHHAIQPQRTLIVSLQGSEEEILGRMKQKTRYNIRLSLKKGVIVRSSPDVNLFHTLMEVTGQRDEFGVHSRNYYKQAYELFSPRGECELFLAEYESQPLAALMVFTHGKRAWYFYGASAEQHRDRMPNYILQWEAMRWARKQGCLTYDLWGVPDFDLDTLENSFLQRRDGLWGVYRFKRGFGGKLQRAVGPWDRVYQPFLYRLYSWWIERKSPNQG